MYPSGAAVHVDIGPSMVAHVGGVHRCGSSWSCPICTPVVRERRAMEIDLGVSVALAEGNGSELATITVPHLRQHRLQDRLPDVSTALRQILKGAPWDRRKERLGYFGAIRSIEVTWGRNGWHPHVHALMLFEDPLSADERLDLRDWMHGRWEKVCADRHFGRLHQRHGIDVRPVATGSELGGYLTKVEGGWTAGRELARSDSKTSTKGLSPWQLLSTVVETGEADHARLWQEYERATFGRQSLVWSPGLRARLLGRDESPSDVELAASEGLDVSTLVRFLIDAEHWTQLQRTGAAGEFLSRCEARARSLVDQAVDLDPNEPIVIDVPVEDTP